MDINSLRASRNSDFSKISSAIENIAAPEAKYAKDERFWSPERDKAGNASATIRFLPRAEGDELPWVKIYSHGFKGPSGRWYIENSLSTIDKQDPVGELNMKLWNSTTDDRAPARVQARAQKRKLNYYANVLIVSDPKHPENNGTVKLFKFGKKIFDKIMSKARPEFEDEDPVNVFDFWEGANFKLRMKQKDGYPNYDDSVFESPSPIAKTDEAILEIAKQQHKLSEFIDPKNFKSYDELKKKLEMVLTGSAPASNQEEQEEQDELPTMQPPQRKAMPAPQMKSKEPDDDDEALKYFQSLVEEE
jgi:hypothetical protein